MSSQSKSYSPRILAMLPAMIAVIFAFATVAAAQEPPPPKWELFGGYSVLILVPMSMVNFPEPCSP